MLERILPIGDGRITGLIGPPEPSGSEPAAAPGATDPNAIPATPPPDVLDALDRAARVVGELGRKNITLSLEHDETAGTVRVKVEQDGSPTGQELSPRALVNLLDGDTSELAPGPTTR